ncbi:hypothetical protein MCOR02_004442 [Pyricularia oryzae]|uniref:Uncharacterized protein n=3 Tax=Pyricularia oryzae TaxID=318829 RepID=A0A4P7MVU5_PYROR|nr:hypothetical protein OOU_Y34scaffold00140g94 [Pyricularia oryzae Y34]KAH8842280.1 hypothetical protein MCOR01_006199 [Pyricularia oryzae]KAH9435515.1 hypothetical protein MCOR02_004442 [Pyricularia oryzae]KAI6270862.1 hypothetical protein MCOR26_008074 [Pyricularia oryzae]KAI6378462.1 hypothetical protein MCOR32_004713 [Pyricularia oryzae]
MSSKAGGFGHQLKVSYRSFNRHAACHTQLVGKKSGNIKWVSGMIGRQDPARCLARQGPSSPATKTCQSREGPSNPYLALTPASPDRLRRRVICHNA